MKAQLSDLTNLIRDLVDHHLEPVKLEDVEQVLHTISAPPLGRALVDSIVESVRRRSLDDGPDERFEDSSNSLIGCVDGSASGDLHLTPEPVESNDSLRRKCATIEKALDGLSPRDRRLIVQFYFEDYSLEQMAEQLQLPLVVLKRQFFEARQNLADVLTDRLDQKERNRRTS